MASAFLFTHERHSHPHTASRDHVMKKVPKTGKINMEGSSDPRSLKRKSMSLNTEGTNIPFQNAPAMTVVDLARLNHGQRSELRKKLKLGLEDVRMVVSRIDARAEELRQVKKAPPPVVEKERLAVTNSDGQPVRRDNNGHSRKDVASVMSDPASSSGETPRDTPKEMSQREARLARQPSVTLPETSFGTTGLQPKRTPKANQLYVNSDFVAGKNKMPPPEKPKSKRVLPGKGESRDPKRQRVEAARAKRESELLKQCTTILKKLMTHKHGWVFNEAVDAEKLGLHDYHTIIKKPMDLGTIKKRLNSKYYTTPGDFAEDIKLTFANAMTYNPVGHDVYVMAQILKGIFEDWWKGMIKKLEEEQRRVDKEEEILANDEDDFEDAPEPVKRMERDVQSFSKGKMGSRAAAPPKPRPEETGKRAMTFEEKRKLSVNLESLPGEKLELIVQIIKKRNPDLGQNEDEIEVDIDSFDNDTLWELDRFVTNYMKSRGKKMKSKAQVPRASAPQVCVCSSGRFLRAYRFSSMLVLEFALWSAWKLVFSVEHEHFVAGSPSNSLVRFGVSSPTAFEQSMSSLMSF